MAPRKSGGPWCKVLYKRQGYPDNYVDPGSFLNALRRNPSTSHPELVQCFLVAGRLNQEVSLCCLCACLFVWLDWNDSADHLLLSLVLVLAVLLGLTAPRLALQKLQSVRQVSGDICVFLLFGFGFSPVLKDLTSTISTDTIYAMVTLAFLVHLFVQDYGSEAPLVSSTLAFNASLFSAVCLASRLRTIAQAFTLLTFSAAVFSGAPMMHRMSSRQSRLFQVCLTATLSLGAFIPVALLSWPRCWGPCLPLLGLQVFLGGFCPWLFHRFQSYKDNIFGPWDEAVVHTFPLPQDVGHVDDTGNKRSTGYLS